MSSLGWSSIPFGSTTSLNLVPCLSASSPHVSSASPRPRVTPPLPGRFPALFAWHCPPSHSPSPSPSPLQFEHFSRSSESLRFSSSRNSRTSSSTPSRSPPSSGSPTFPFFNIPPLP